MRKNGEKDERTISEPLVPHDIVDALIRERLRALGSQGGKKRAEGLPAKRRAEIAKKAAQARWGKGKKAKGTLGGALKNHED